MDTYTDTASNQDALVSNTVPQQGTALMTKFKFIAVSIGLLSSGFALFHCSFIVGESSFIGECMHLAGCGLFCMGVHRQWHLH